jgi:putative SOS response-associated peptidase YedK
MCYSAIVQQSLHVLARRFLATIDWGAYERLFADRADGQRLDIPRALDQYVLELSDREAHRSQELIAQYRDRIEAQWQQELFKQRTRVGDRSRELQAKETKAGRRDLEIGLRKAAALSEKLRRLRSSEVSEDDKRIFPRWYAPVIVEDGGNRVIRPMRYQCRIAGKPAVYDKRFPGTYNARRDSLNEFWAPLYGSHHAIIVVESFFENVPRHLYEKRELAPGETEQNAVLHFNPDSGVPMLIACLWSHWSGEGEPSLDSFAAITDEPPPEILETGHTRCIVSIQERNVNDWLSPAGLTRTRLEEVLTDKVMPVYEHMVEQQAA